MMITFLLYTLLAWVANACLVKIIYISIQPGQWIDKLLKWQNRLHQWDMEGKEFLVKTGGMCELCFSHLFTFISYWAYLFFMQAVAGYWITTPVDGTMAAGIVNVIWYLAYVGIGTNMALYFITRLFQS